jgi:hypothetical protein
MPVGLDIIVDGRPFDGEGVFVIDWLRRFWPDAVVLPGDGTELLAFDHPSIGRMEEFFVFRSAYAHTHWAEHGRSDNNDHLMAHVILGPTSLTLVTAEFGFWSSTRTLEDFKHSVLAYRRAVRALLLKQRLQLEKLGGILLRGPVSSKEFFAFYRTLVADVSAQIGETPQAQG